MVQCSLYTSGPVVRLRTLKLKNHKVSITLSTPNTRLAALSSTRSLFPERHVMSRFLLVNSRLCRTLREIAVSCFIGRCVAPQQGNLEFAGLRHVASVQVLVYDSTNEVFRCVLMNVPTYLGRHGAHSG